MLEGPAIVTDVSMAVEEARRNVPPGRRKNLRPVPAGVPGTWAYIANTPVENGDLHPIKNFAGANIDALPASDNKVRFDLPHRAEDQSFQLYLCATHGTLTNMVHFSLPKERDYLIHQSRAYLTSDSFATYCRA